MKKYKILPFLFIIFLSGCWNNAEIDQRGLVHGAGFALNEETGMLEAYVEIVKPSSSSDGGGTGTFQSVENLVLKVDTESPLQGAREFIRYAKRRLYFGHTRLWLVQEEFAKEKFTPIFDVVRRDAMNRLNSYIFITRNNVEDIFNTATLYQELSSDEIVSAVEQTKYTAEFIPVRLYEFIKLNEENLNTAYVPIINIVDNVEGPVTSIEGTAVIKNEHMVGELNVDETVALSLLLNKAEGGVIPVPKLEEKEIISMEVTKSNVKVHPTLEGRNLHVRIEVDIEGELGDDIMEKPEEINEQFMQEAEKLVEKELKNNIKRTLSKLKELKTDITNIGKETYRSYPKEWQEIKQNYHDEIFPDAVVDIEVTANMYHQGLTNESVNQPHKKPYNNPFPFLD